MTDKYEKSCGIGSKLIRWLKVGGPKINDGNQCEPQTVEAIVVSKRLEVTFA